MERWRRVKEVNDEEVRVSVCVWEVDGKMLSELLAVGIKSEVNDVIWQQWGQIFNQFTRNVIYVPLFSAYFARWAFETGENIWRQYCGRTRYRHFQRCVGWKRLVCVANTFYLAGLRQIIWQPSYSFIHILRPPGVPTFVCMSNLSFSFRRHSHNKCSVVSSCLAFYNSQVSLWIRCN